MWCAFGLPIALFLEYYYFTHPLMGFDLLVPAVLEHVLLETYQAMLWYSWAKV